MPYKDIHKRRAAEASAKRKYRNTEEGRKKEHARHLAVQEFPVASICSIKSCEQVAERHHPDYEFPKDIIWLCKQHHEAVHHPSECSIVGCGLKHRAKGLCNKHWKKERYSSDEALNHRRKILNEWRAKKRSSPSA